jgi:hypothetical protein
MINNMYKALMRLAVPVTVNHVSQTTASGVVSETYASGSMSMATVLFRPDLLRYLPEGAYTHKDRKFYEVGPTVSLGKRDTIGLGTELYRVNEIYDHTRDGCFTEYWTKLQ